MITACHRFYKCVCFLNTVIIKTHDLLDPGTVHFCHMDITLTQSCLIPFNCNVETYIFSETALYCSNEKSYANACEMNWISRFSWSDLTTIFSFFQISLTLLLSCCLHQDLQCGAVKWMWKAYGESGASQQAHKKQKELLIIFSVP